MDTINGNGGLSKSAKHYIEDAIRFYNEQRYQESLNAFEQVIRIDPVSVKALHGRGIILIRIEEYKKAIESFEQASKLAPSIAKIHLDMAEVFYIIKNFEKSGSTYRRAIQLNKTYQSVYRNKEQELTNIALGFYRRMWFERAITAFQQVLLFSPENLQAPYYLSILKPSAPMTFSSPNPSKSIERKPSMDDDNASANNQWNIFPSVHPANCRCVQCWEP